MKKLLFIIPVLVMMQACTPKVTTPAVATKTTPKVMEKVAPTTTKLNNALDSISYAYGLSIAQNFRGMEQTSGQKLFNEAMIRNGINEGYNGKAQLSESDMENLIQQHQTVLMEAKRREQKLAGEKNKMAGEQFLEKNKTKAGVKATASGLQYIVQKEGAGVTPTRQDKVKVHYEGRLINGDIFDSSIQRGKPTSFGVGQVIAGWTEGLQLMKVGSKYTFFIPANLAYGERGAGAKIGPHSTLIFDVELLGIE